MRRLEARRLRRELMLRPDVRLTIEQVYELVLQETDDPAQASKAASSYAAAQLRAGQTPQ